MALLGYKSSFKYPLSPS